MKNYLLKSMLVVAFAALTSLTYAQTDVVLTVVDESKTLTEVAAKGAWDGWATLTDMTKADGGEGNPNTFTLTVQVTDDGDYEWGAVQKDGTDNGIWLAPSPNPKFTNTGGTITGDISFTVAVATSANITVSVDMTFEISKGGFDVATDSVGLAGPVNEWGFTKLTKGATDSIYSGTFSAANVFEYKFRKNDGWEGSPNRIAWVDGSDVTKDKVWYSDISPAPLVTVVQYVVDGTEYYTGLQYKGEITGWSLVPMYDDGTHGDVTAGDHTWTVTNENVAADAGYEWGAVDADENWLIAGDNPEVTIALDGTVGGDVTYTIPAWGTVPVTFTVDMNCHINLDVFSIADSCLDVNIDGYPPVEMTHVDSGIFAATVTRFTAAEELAYTYRIGCAFGGDYEEYPGDASNRTYTVVAGTNETGVELFQDDVLTSSCDYVGIENAVASKIQVYPNPAGYEVKVNSEFMIQSIDLYNITGQRMISKEVNGFDSFVNVSDLKEGIYMISVNGTRGERAFTKIVKN